MEDSYVSVYTVKFQTTSYSMVLHDAAPPPSGGFFSAGLPQQPAPINKIHCD